MNFSPTSCRGEETASGCSSCSSPEVDVVACTPRPVESTSSSEDDQKRYFCQRCLNHKEQHPRKGHKPFCRYATCECADCRMVEERRRLNNMLSRRRFETDSGDEKTVGKKVRDPKCALCSAHGEKQPLRGHKKAQCPFLKCGCHLCGLVENRRTLMARQIKLRRDQQKQRKAQLLVNTTSANFQSQISPINMNEAAKDDVGMTTLVSPEKEKLSEPLRVPPLMPVPVKPDCTAPFTPLLLQHSPVLAASSSMLLPPPVPAPPVTIASTITAPSAIEQLDLRLIPPISAPYPVMSPYNFHFPPIFPYTTALQFLTS